MKKKQIDWDRLWDDHDTWWQNALLKQKRCKKCHHHIENEPDWEDQKKIIQKLVEKAIT